MTLKTSHAAIAHVRFDGRSLDVPLTELGIAGDASERDIKLAVARHLDVSEDRLHDYVIDYHETGNVTVRPSAVFG